MTEKCPYCGGKRIAKRGLNGTKQRYRCHSCKKSFSGGKNALVKKEWVLRLYLNNISQRRIAQMACVSRKTVTRWIKEGNMQGVVICSTLENHVEKETIMIKNLKKYLKKEQKGEPYALLLTSKGSVALDLR